MDKNEFSMESRRMKALAWVYSWMNGHITDWEKVVAFANVGDFNGFEDEIKRQTDCYYPSEQSRAWFHALRLVTKGDVEEFLCLGVQSPAPDEKDENGLMPCPAIKWEQSPSNKNRINGKLPSFCGQWYSVTKNKDGGKYLTWRGGGIGSFDTQEEAMRHCEEQWYKLWTDEMRTWNTRAHAPISGKDRTNEAIRVCADFAEAVVSSLKEKHRSLKEKHEREVSKLIEALEIFLRTPVFDKLIPTKTSKEYNQAEAMVDAALAAYKGKEGESMQQPPSED